MIDRGFTDLVWFIGSVEDNNDPQMLGRVRVRAFGIHPIEQTEVPTEELPWAFVVSGTYSAAYKPPEIGAWTWGFFIDGRNCQQPILLGTFLGMPTDIPASYGDNNSGFNVMGDGGTLPNIYQPDMSRLARAEDLHNTSVLVQNVSGDETVKTSDGKEWKTPTSSYGATYPNNFVQETKSGHVFELDDTPGAERINLFHKDGSYIEMGQGGRTVIKTSGHGYVIIDQNGYMYVRGDYNINVDGNANITVKNDVNLNVSGNMNSTVRGDFVISASGRIDLNAGETIRARAAGMTLEAATDNVDIVSKNNMNLKSGNGVNVKSGTTTNIQSAANMNLKSGAAMNTESSAGFNIKAGGAIAQTGSKIHLNDGGAAAQSAADAADASVSDMIQPEHRETSVRMQQLETDSYGYGGGDVGFGEPYDSGGSSGGGGGSSYEGYGSPTEGGGSVEQPLNPSQEIPSTTEAVYNNDSGDQEVERFREWLNFIAQCEGTDARDGYNETLGYGILSGGRVNLTSMTLGQLKNLQSRMLKHPANRWNSSACGRYQIVRKTIVSLQARYRIPDSALFDATMQDKMAVWLTKGRKCQPAGLKNEWASLKRLSNDVIRSKCPPMIG